MQRNSRVYSGNGVFLLIDYCYNYLESQRVRKEVGKQDLVRIKHLCPSYIRQIFISSGCRRKWVWPWEHLCFFVFLLGLASQITLVNVSRKLVSNITLRECLCLNSGQLTKLSSRQISGSLASRHSVMVHSCGKVRFSASVRVSITEHWCPTMEVTPADHCSTF